MSTRLRVILGLPTLGLLVLAGLAWYLGFFAADPDEASLVDATAILAENESEADGAGAGASGTITDLSGTWTVETGEATYVGYRVNEVLSTVGDFTAVGRTPLVEGSLRAEGLTTTSVTIPNEGDLFTTLASGELTIHGQSQPVELQVEGTVQGSRLVIIGRMDIVMSNFGIEPPSAPLVASIEDQGVMELSLIFVRA